MRRYPPFFDTTKEIFTEAEPVFNVAVTVAVLLVVYEPATIEKLPVVAPEATVSVAGAVINPVVVSATSWPPAGAGPLSVTLQFEDCCGFRDVGLQVSPVTTRGGTSERVADADPPFRDAVTFAELLAVNEPAVTVKVVLAAAAGMLTLDGAVTVPLVVTATL